MRTCRLLCGCLMAFALSPVSLCSQAQEGPLNWRPTPTSPYDPVTLPAHSLVTPGERARALISAVS
jgi:hypothetical protein